MTNYFTNRDIILEKLSFDLDDFEQAIQEKIEKLEKEDCFLVGIERTSFTDSNDSDKGKHHCCFIRYVRPKYQLIWESRHTGQNTVRFGNLQRRRTSRESYRKVFRILS